MAISGHRTVSMFIRDNITSDADQVEALKRTAEHLASKPKSEQEETKLPKCRSVRPLTRENADKTRTVRPAS